jgi:hypothetical protein
MMNSPYYFGPPVLIDPVYFHMARNLQNVDKPLRRLHLIPGNSTVHPRATFGPTESHDDQPKPKRGVTSADEIAPCEMQEPGKPPL